MNAGRTASLQSTEQAGQHIDSEYALLADSAHELRSMWSGR
jgi:hypothetical protein